MAYSIDSFSEYSATAVGRTPTRAIVPSTAMSFTTCVDEELFRDLFADADADDSSSQRDLVFGATPSASHKKAKANLTPNKPVVWNTGATLAKPFASPPLPQQPRNNQTPLAPVTSMAPTLTASIPRQNAVELITARPPATNDEEDEDPLTHLGLARVPEVNEEDEVDGNTMGLKMPTQFKSARRLLAPVTLQHPGSPSMQQETLQFLEKLDLKSLLSQPRPDVTSFLPSGNQVNHRVEDGDQQRPTAPLVSNVPTRKPLSSRKEPLHSVQGATRLAHVAETYGTTTGGPRRARKETLERLSNPISGYTSTLQALSPELRKKREAELGRWPPPETATTPVRTLTSKKTRDLIERLSEAHNTHESSSARTQVKKLIKGKKTVKVAVKTASKPSRKANADSMTSTNSQCHPQPTIDERKMLLKQKLANRGSTQLQSETTSSGSTFLTQHEDLEAKLANSGTKFRRSNRKLIPQKVAECKLPHNPVIFPQRPVLPPSMRARVTSPTASNTSGKLVKPNTTPQKKSFARPRVSSSVTKEISPQKVSTTRSRGANTSNEPTKRDDRRAPLSKKSSSAATLSSTLLGASTGSGPKTPARSVAKPRARSTSGTKATTSGAAIRASLPLIRRPEHTRPTAPASSRLHRVRAPNGLEYVANVD